MDRLTFHIKATITFHKAAERYRKANNLWMAEVCEACAEQNADKVRELTSKSSPSTF